MSSLAGVADCDYRDTKDVVSLKTLESASAVHFTTEGRRRSGGVTMHVRTAGVAIATGLITSALSLTGPGSAAQRLSDPGVCAGVSGCRVMAHADVNGDGVGDDIGMARRGGDSAPKGAVIVRVKTGPGSIASTRVATQYWYGPLWQGVAVLDGKGGKEIVVGYTMGAHFQSYRALTWRDGDLVTLSAPGRDKYWGIDGAVWISMGWQRLTSNPAGTIRKRVAVRTGDATTSPFKGRVTTFKWRPGGWNVAATKTFNPLPDRTAYSWGGFHVPGLTRW